jgi:uncharacterized membrane protein
MNASKDTAYPGMRSAKVPRTPLAGPYGHPFHPIAITIPIGAWTASLVFDIIGMISDDPEPFAIGARVLVLIGLIGAVVAAVVGLLDLSRIPGGTPARRTGVIHAVLNTAAIILFTIGLVIRFAVGDEISGWGVAISVVALGGLGISGWLGGKLSYRWGVRVADESTQREGYVQA